MRPNRQLCIAVSGGDLVTFRTSMLIVVQGFQGFLQNSIRKL